MRNPKKIRVVLFDDSILFQEFIQIMLGTRKEIDFVGAFENADNLMRDIKSAKPDLVLMDIDMPGTDGISAMKDIRKKFPELHVIMLTDLNDEKLIVNAITAGANGYVLKSSSEEEIIQAILDVCCGGGSLSPAVTQKLLSFVATRSGRGERRQLESLSARENEVLNHLIEGRPYKIIASEMNVCYDTVRAHIKSIYRKLGVSSVSGVVSVAMRTKEL